MKLIFSFLFLCLLLQVISGLLTELSALRQSRNGNDSSLAIVRLKDGIKNRLSGLLQRDTDSDKKDKRSRRTPRSENEKSGSQCNPKASGTKDKQGDLDYYDYGNKRNNFGKGGPKSEPISKDKGPKDMPKRRNSKNKGDLDYYDYNENRPRSRSRGKLGPKRLLTQSRRNKNRERQNRPIWARPHRFSDYDYGRSKQRRRGPKSFDRRRNERTGSLRNENSTSQKRRRGGFDYEENKRRNRKNRSKNYDNNSYDYV